MKNLLNLTFYVAMAGSAYWIYGVDAETHQAVRDFVATHVWATIVADIIVSSLALIIYLLCYVWWLSSLGTKLSTEIAKNAAKEKQGRNESCACGSGLKFKNCCAHIPKMASDPGAMMDSVAHIASQAHPRMAILFWPFLAIHKRSLVSNTNKSVLKSTGGK